MHLRNNLLDKLVVFFTLAGMCFYTNAQVISQPVVIPILSPQTVNYTVSASTLKRVNMNVTIQSNYASLSIEEGGKTLLDNIDIPQSGTHSLNALLKFDSTGTTQLKLIAKGANVTINSLNIVNIANVAIPNYSDISSQIGLVDEPSLKYGGPSVADIDNDGNYDFILNNHNDSPSKLYFNNGDGTLTKHNGDLGLWNKMDLHGSAAGDYDNDGDLDVVVTLGGGNGTNPKPPAFYKNNDGALNLDANGGLAVGIDTGARGRSPRWMDFDLDGDLDLAMFNAAGINTDNGARHTFYLNDGSGAFTPVSIPGLETASGDRVLVTDLNNDYIEDVVILSPLSMWRGNGDLTFTNMTNSWLPPGLRGRTGAMAAADVDIDNDGDFDLYLASGKGYFSIASQNSVDFDPTNQRVDFRLSGNSGVSPFDVNASGAITLSEFETVFRSTYNGDFPIFLGSSKDSQIIDDQDASITITKAMASGWPASRTENGLYVGHTGGDNWKFESVRNGNIFWSIHFTLNGVSNFIPGWAPSNRNVSDILLRNDGGSFTNVSSAWNIPKGGNHWGVTFGDFNNDSYNDLYVHRFGFLKNRLSDYMLLNNGNGRFETITSHNAANPGARNHGDMGQAFDFDLDGNVDILNGDDEYGLWHLYQNNKTNNGNYTIVKVGYAPTTNIDPLSADITVKVGSNTYHKRVGSAGEVHSQSLLNMVHFGLASATTIDSVTVRWRNGETKQFNNVTVNQIIDTGSSTAANTVSITNAPSSIVSGENINVSITYNSSGTYQLVALINSPSGTWIKNTKRTINAGSGVETLTIVPPSPLAVANGYTLGVVIRPVGGNWSSNLDNKSTTFNVTSN